MADIVPVAASVVKYTGASTDTVTAGEAVTQGMTVYQHTDGKMYKALCDTAAHAACVGVSLNSASAGQPLEILKGGGLNPGVAVVVGVVYGVTDTAGGISDVVDRGATDYLTILGVATTTSRINVAINASGAVIA